MAKRAPRLRLVDTTFRDAQQSLLGGHLRGDEIVPIAVPVKGGTRHVEACAQPCRDDLDVRAVDGERCVLRRLLDTAREPEEPGG